MKASVMKYLVTVALIVVTAVVVTISTSLAQSPYEWRGWYCIPQYDTSGAQMAPYC